MAVIQKSLLCDAEALLVRDAEALVRDTEALVRDAQALVPDAEALLSHDADPSVVELSSCSEAMVALMHKASSRSAG